MGCKAKKKRLQKNNFITKKARDVKRKRQNKMKLNVTVAKSTQEAMPEIGRKEKTTYYLKVNDDITEIVLNVGENTYNTINQMSDENNNKQGGKQKTP